MSAGRICELPECAKPHIARGLCGMHYRRARIAGQLTPPPTIEQRFWSKVHKTDSCWIWTSSDDGHGYGQFGMNYTMRKAHRVAYELTKGQIPDGMMLDHVCRNRICVNPAHLRPVTNKQNLENLSGASKGNKSSGIRGVYWSKAAEKWEAKVMHNRRSYYLGLFATTAEAEAAVIAKRNELFTHNDMDRAA